MPDAYILHGFLVVDATIGGKPYRFVNTHLENGYVDGFPGVIQSAQAVQILEAMAGTAEERKLIIVGDMNSDPSDAVDPESPIPATPYMLFAGAGLFDVWLYRPGNVVGLTCCQAEELMNRASMLTRRIDLILTREEPRTVKDARLIGEVAADRLGPPGRSLWPTDHASVAAGIRY
jgi:endonuclease/exonuclease/phosphatase family metal-dependent hydrolase